MANYHFDGHVLIRSCRSVLFFVNLENKGQNDQSGNWLYCVEESRELFDSDESFFVVRERAEGEGV